MSKGKKILIASASGVVAVVVVVTLVVTLIVQPNQRAAQAAAQASAKAAQDHQTAVAAFNTASQACTDANNQLSTTLSSATQAASATPAMLQDPSLLDTLDQAIATAKTVPPCTPPTMAGDTATIQQQTTQLNTDTQSVTKANSTVVTARQAVASSIQAKSDAAAAASEAKTNAAAPAEASAAATQQAQVGELVNKTSVTATDSNGYKAALALQCTDWIKGSDTTTTQTAWQNVGGVGDIPMSSGGSFGGGRYESFTVKDTTVGAFAFCTLAIQNASSGYHLSNWMGGRPDFFVGFHSPAAPGGPLTPWTANVGDGVGGLCFVYSDTTECGRLNQMDWEVEPSISDGSDQWGPIPVVIYADNVFTPNYPNGNPGLGKYGVNIQVASSNYKSDPVTLNIGW